VYISITPLFQPIAYGRRVDNLMLAGFTRKEAEQEALKPMELEIYFDPETSMFLVDPGAVDSGTIYNPYSGEFIEE
jgi:hypothetical protein